MRSTCFFIFLLYTYFVCESVMLGVMAAILDHKDNSRNIAEMLTQRFDLAD